jgi:transcriptional antiterminator RfaH
MNWYVVYTKPKWEKKTASKLNEIGINAYCPLISKVSQWTDRKKTIEVPLFNSYIFVQIDEKNRNTIFSVLGVVRYLFWLGKPAVVKNAEIEQIQNWLANSSNFNIVVDKWQKGDRVTLESGPFASKSAIVQEVQQKHYLLVLESMGFVLKIEKKIENE